MDREGGKQKELSSLHATERTLRDRTQGGNQGGEGGVEIGQMGKTRTERKGNREETVYVEQTGGRHGRLTSGSGFLFFFFFFFFFLPRPHEELHGHTQFVQLPSDPPPFRGRQGQRLLRNRTFSVEAIAAVHFWPFTQHQDKLPPPA